MRERIMHRYAEIPLPATGIPNIYKIKGWTITVSRCPILSSGEIDAATNKLKLPMPEMIFGNNHLELSYSPDPESETETFESSEKESGFQQWGLRFDAYNALDQVNKTGSQIEGGLLQVAHSKTWQKSTERVVQECPDEIQGIVKPYDWTYTTDYKGDERYVTNKSKASDDDTRDTITCEGDDDGVSCALKQVGPEEGSIYEKRGIPFEKLKVQEPIHFFDQVILYEDELGDNGIVKYYLKVRVMANRLLLLSRLFLRVDGVIFRVRDTRVYVEFNYECTMDPSEKPDPESPDYKHIGQPYVVREYTEHEEQYDVVRQMVPRTTRDYSMYLRDYDWVAAHIPVKKRTREYCFLSKYTGTNTSPAPQIANKVKSQAPVLVRKVVVAPGNKQVQPEYHDSRSKKEVLGSTAATPGTTTIPSSLLLPVSGSRVPPGRPSNS